MNPSDVTPATLLSIVRDAVRRRVLLAAMEIETVSPPPLSNAVADAADCCVAAPEELAEMVELLLPEDLRRCCRRFRRLGEGVAWGDEVDCFQFSNYR